MPAQNFVWQSVSNQKPIMEEVLIRFPHLGDNIFKKLDSKSLIKCKKVNRTFNNFLKVERSSYCRVIQWYTNCSETLMREIAKKSGGAIIIVSVLREIFGNFMRGTKQNSKYLEKWANTPLHFAADRGHLAAYQLIMENIDNKNPLHLISDLMQWKYMKREEKHVFSTKITTPLHLAAKNGHLSVCKLIIENVLDKNPTGPNIHWFRKQICHWTPLHLAAHNGHFSVCELIINNILEKNPKDQNGWTPLHSAAQNGHVTVCQLILSNIRSSFISNTNTLFNVKDTFGNTPLKLATQYQHKNIRNIILEFMYNKE